MSVRPRFRGNEEITQPQIALAEDLAATIRLPADARETMEMPVVQVPDVIEPPARRSQRDRR